MQNLFAERHATASAGHTEFCGPVQSGRVVCAPCSKPAISPIAQANLTAIPDDLANEDVILLADIASTGFSATENGKIRLGDTVAVFAQGPIGLCATLGARLMGAAEIFAVDSDAGRLAVAREFGATVTLNASENVVNEILSLTGGRGVDVAIEALGKQITFENALRVLAPGGVLSSVGVYSGHLSVPLDAIRAGWATKQLQPRFVREERSACEG